MKKIYLSNTNKKFYGVCGGIGEAYDIDPVLIRAVFVLIAFVTVFLPAFFAYLIMAWFIIPSKV